MNLSPAWTAVFTAEAWEAVHWSTIGDPRATDSVVLAWAREHEYVVFTHDLDFATLLALTRSTGPSVVQVRAHDLLPARLGPLVIATLRRYASELESGVLLTIDESDSRIRLLPINDPRTT